jgi:ABC-type glycerol-3-phosphate transport system permease component
MRKSPWWQQGLVYLILISISAFVLIPIWGVVYLAFDGGIKGWPSSFRIWPEQPTFEVFRQVWARPYQDQAFIHLLKNSLLVSLGAALISVSFGASMAYAFARYRFPGRKVGLFSLLIGAYLPLVALMTPLFILLQSIGLRTTLFGLMIVYTAFSIPFCIWNMRTAFQSVSKELEESAFLDGASPGVAFWKVSLPLALPSIAVAGLIAFLLGYSEFAMGWLFVEKSQNVTLAMSISGILVGSYMESWARLAALAVLMSLPVVIVFILLQRNLLDRYLVGGVNE